ncbi:MAG TPA: sigma 54-interacting transcriptional regulator, partial [Candidatus Deferrimicrobium sp.]|nr:sigma 54-interacting transcriptional regulator [Candidatus Deferrimicrobium sp.]
LFGHVKGAFTGAVRDKKGKFELADGGTLFLDEVSELSSELQAKLLRVIQERVIEPVGGERRIEIDVRIIAATNVTLKERVAAGKFRDDLFYRLNVIPLRLPSLRERPEDISILVDHFLKKFGRTEAIDVHPDLLLRLKDYSWPGNIRELENLVERMVILRNGNLLTVSDLPADFGASVSVEATDQGTARVTFHEAERKLIFEALAKSGWNRSKAAKYLSIPRHVLIYRMKKYGLTEESSAEALGR